MKAEDVTTTLNLALKASGLDQAKVIHRPRLLSDNGSSYLGGMTPLPEIGHRPNARTGW
jgi:putative transposase